MRFLTLASLFLLAASPLFAGTLADQVTRHYVTQAHERYSDSYEKAKTLRTIARQFFSDTTAENHEKTKAAWLDAHRTYCKTEVFRFGNPNVDAWEGKVNAWPIDEGFIDYVNEKYYKFEETNQYAVFNYIGKSALPVHDEAIKSMYDQEDAKIDIKLIDFETNVARGYHTLEFLLWGQDTNTEDDLTPGGNRLHTDFLPKSQALTDVALRRVGYTRACLELLVADLRRMVFDWDGSKKSRSVYARSFLDLPVEQRLDRILIGMGSLSHGELAGERIQVALLAADQEDEQNCFSDTTHLVTADNAHSIETIYRGINPPSELSGPSLSELVKKVNPELDTALLTQMAETKTLVTALENDFFKKRKQPFDRMISESNTEGRAHLFKLIESLGKQTELLEDIRKLIPEMAKH